MITRVFVYGTLKRGMRNAHYLKGQHFLGEATTKPAYRMVSLGWYPGVVADSENGRPIQGEVWEINDVCKERLDVLEGVDLGEYEAVHAKLEPPFDRSVVWMYLYSLDVSLALDAGENWKDP